MYLKTKRLTITDFTPDMAYDVHVNSLDEDNRRFVPDEVFETVDDAKETVEFLIGCYGGNEGPFVHPILLNDDTNIGYVQLVQLDSGAWDKKVMEKCGFVHKFEGIGDYQGEKKSIAKYIFKR